MPWRIAVHLLSHSLECLRDDGEFALYRARTKQAGEPSVLALTPASPRPSRHILKKIDHEYSLRSELDPVWAVRPLCLSEYGTLPALVLEDPGGETLDRYVS